jgi:hypothetical protein
MSFAAQEPESSQCRVRSPVAAFVVAVFPIVAEFAGVQIRGKISFEIEAVFPGDPFDIKRRRAAADAIERVFVDPGTLLAMDDPRRIAGIQDHGLEDDIVRQLESTLQVRLYVGNVIEKAKVNEQIKMTAGQEIAFEIALLES